MAISPIHGKEGKLHGVSVAIPVLNEERIIPELVKRLKDAFKDSEPPLHELIFVDDGSTDNTVSLLHQETVKDPRVKVLSLSRNFGHQIAVSAALEHATGSATVVIDGDLQDPPEVIPELITKWKEGFDVVYAVRRTRSGETWFKKASAKLFYRTLRNLADIEIPLDTGDFALMDKNVVDVLNKMPEHARFLRGLRAWAGFRSTGVFYNRADRFAGSTKYPFRKMLGFATTGILAFSMMPLRLATYVGLFMALISFIVGIVIIVLKLTTGLLVQGWASIVLSVFFVGGVQLFIIGILGEYIGRIYNEVRNRPLYVLREKLGFEEV